MPDIALPVSQARRDLLSLIRDVDDTFARYIITSNGTPKAVLMSFDEFEAYEETLEILSDPEAMADLKEARAARERGETYALEDVKREVEDAR